MLLLTYIFYSPFGIPKDGEKTTTVNFDRRAAVVFI